MAIDKTAFHEARQALDRIADPGTMLATLRDLAQSCAQSAMECASGWQDESAGAPWSRISSELEKAIARIEKHRDFAEWKQS